MLFPVPEIKVEGRWLRLTDIVGDPDALKWTPLARQNDC